MTMTQPTLTKSVSSSSLFSGNNSVVASCNPVAVKPNVASIGSSTSLNGSIQASNISTQSLRNDSARIRSAQPPPVSFSKHLVTRGDPTRLRASQPPPMSLSRHLATRGDLSIEAGSSRNSSSSSISGQCVISHGGATMHGNSSVNCRSPSRTFTADTTVITDSPTKPANMPVCSLTWASSTSPQQVQTSNT